MRRMWANEDIMPTPESHVDQQEPLRAALATRTIAGNNIGIKSLREHMWQILRDRLWRARNREHLRDKERKYRMLHPEKKKEKNKKHYTGNKEKINAKRKETTPTREHRMRQILRDRLWRARNREHLRDKERNYRALHPEQKKIKIKQTLHCE